MKYKTIQQHQQIADEYGYSAQPYDEGNLGCVKNGKHYFWYWNGKRISETNAHAWIAGADIPMPEK